MVGNMFSLCKFSNSWFIALGKKITINTLIVNGGLQFWGKLFLKPLILFIQFDLRIVPNLFLATPSPVES